MPRTVRVVALTALTLLSLSGCAVRVAGDPVGVDESGSAAAEQVQAYFTELNSAGADGPGTQRDFLRRTQHPDFTDRLCDLGGLTLTVQPAMSTLRRDPGWKPDGKAEVPRGDIQVVAVTVSIRRDSTSLGEQIGSQRVVLLDGRPYGFSPCPSG